MSIKSAGKHVLLQVVGWILVLVGLAAMVLPGPGLLALFAGMAMLATQYEWADRRLAPIRRAALRGAADSVKSRLRILLSGLAVLALIGLGICWGVSPPAPAVWPVDDEWWLAGGWGTGATLIGSGVIAAGMLVYSYVNFRNLEDPEEQAVDAGGDRRHIVGRQNIPPGTTRIETTTPVGRTSRTVAGAALSMVLGLLLLTATLVGPLVADRVRFHMSPDALVQYVGGEIVTAIVAVVLIASAPAWWLGQQWPTTVAGGAAAYAVYTFATVVAGQEYDRYPGNVEKAFLLYAAITAAGVALLVITFRALVAAGNLDGPRHVSGGVLIAVGVIVALLWLGQLAGFYRTGPTPEYDSATSLFWLIKYLDLGFVIPLAIMTGVLQRRPSPGTDAAAVTMLGFLTFLLAALLLMALEMLRRETPGASWVLAIGLVVLLAPSAALWVRWQVSRA